MLMMLLMIFVVIPYIILYGMKLRGIANLYAFFWASCIMMLIGLILGATLIFGFSPAYGPNPFKVLEDGGFVFNSLVFRDNSYDNPNVSIFGFGISFIHLFVLDLFRAFFYINYHMFGFWLAIGEGSTLIVVVLWFRVFNSMGVFTNSGDALTLRGSDEASSTEDIRLEDTARYVAKYGYKDWHPKDRFDIEPLWSRRMYAHKAGRPLPKV